MLLEYLVPFAADFRYPTHPLARKLREVRYFLPQFRWQNGCL